MGIWNKKIPRPEPEEHFNYNEEELQAINKAKRRLQDAESRVYLANQNWAALGRPCGTRHSPRGYASTVSRARHDRHLCREERQEAYRAYVEAIVPPRLHYHRKKRAASIEGLAAALRGLPKVLVFAGNVTHADYPGLLWRMRVGGHVFGSVTCTLGDKKSLTLATFGEGSQSPTLDDAFFRVTAALAYARAQELCAANLQELVRKHEAQWGVIAEHVKSAAERNLLSPRLSDST